MYVVGHLEYEVKKYLVKLKKALTIFLLNLIAVNKSDKKMDLDKDSLGLDFKDMDSSSVDTLTVGIDSIAQDCDFSELVDSIYNDKVQLFSSK